MQDNYYSKSDLELMVGQDENILWRGKPDKKCFILEGIFNPMLPFALIWFLFDSVFIIAIISSFTNAKAVTPTLAVPLLFIIFHLMPVWIYLAGAILTFQKYKHTGYIITDKGVYVSGGLFSYTCQMKPYAELSRINIHRGIIDQFLHVGDVVFSGNDIGVGDNSRSRILNKLTISDIHDYQNVFTLVKQLQTDIYSDTMFPNDLRPEENHGYKTKYKGLD